MKKGFTLMELMVYIALIGIIVLVAGQAFSDSAKFRVRSKNMISTSETASNLSELLKEDFAQMGTKAWKDVGASTSADVFDVDDSVYVKPSASSDDALDSSSYELTRNAGMDAIAFRKMEYDGEGNFVAVRKISWSVDADSALWRSCRTLSGTESSDCPKSAGEVVPVKMATTVSKFSVEPSVPGRSSSSGSDTLFPASSSSGFRLIAQVDTVGNHFYPLPGISPVAGGTSVNLGPFAYAANSSSSGEKAAQVYVAPEVESVSASDTWKKTCQQFVFEPGEVYAFGFDLLYLENDIRGFQPGVDHFSVGLRLPSNGNPVSGLDDFMIYPPPTSKAPTARFGKFSVKEKTTACFAMTFAFYSPTAYRGHLDIVNFTVLRESEETFFFNESESYNPAAGEKKKKVKAFLLKLEVYRKGEVGRIRLILPVPSNGTSATATST